MAADVTTSDGVPLLREQVPRVDVLVNDLGIVGAPPALEITNND